MADLDFNLMDHFKPGIVIDASIKRKIDPGIIELEISDQFVSTISILDLDWNLSASEIKFKSLDVGDRIQAAVYEYNKELGHIRFSVKHLLPKPSETAIWSEIRSGNKVQGKVLDLLSNGSIIQLSNGLTGIIYQRDYSGEDYIVVKKDPITNLLVLSSPGIEKSFSPLAIEDITTTIKPKDLKVQSFSSFKTSLYAQFATPEDLEKIKSGYAEEADLFSKEFHASNRLVIEFGFDSNSWDIFQNQIVPSLSDRNSYSDEAFNTAIQHIESSSFWIRISKRDSEEFYFTLYNENLNFYGQVKLIDEEACQFLTYSVSIGRKNSNASYGKKNCAKYGSFLLSPGITIATPFETVNPKISKNQVKIFSRLALKQEAFEIFDKLKIKTGEILKDEGEALIIFDKFLEFQEDYVRKNQPEPIPVNNLKRTHGSHHISWILPDEVYDYLGDQEEGEIHLDLREKVKSTKKNRQFEYKKIGDSRAIKKSDSWHLLVQDSLPLDEIKDLFIQKKVSLKQFQVQREIIRDFFDKKLTLDHVENLLVKPDRIKSPLEQSLVFKNEFLQLTEKEQPDNNQVKAVKKAVGNQNIFLIQGPPGTGKTTVIAEVVKQLVESNEKILVASQTHIAVDNVLEKLATDQDLSLLRIGVKNRILDSVKHFHPSEQIKLYKQDFIRFLDLQREVIDLYIKGMEEINIKAKVRIESKHFSEPLREKLVNMNFQLIQILHSKKGINSGVLLQVLDKWKEDITKGLEDIIAPLLYSSVDVVFATCIGIKSDKEFANSNFKFDTVIIDEAGKANLAESLVAISMAEKIILVGDQLQLPPYIDGSLIDPQERNSFPNSKYGKNFLSEDIEHALKTSFFEFLVNRIESNRFPNSNKEMLNYQHRMHPNIGKFVSYSFYDGHVNMGARTHLNKLHLPFPFDKEITFVNTSSFKDPFEDSDGYSARNKTEAAIIVQNVLPNLRLGGVEAHQIAVIAPYKSQVALIKVEIENSRNQDLVGIEVSTLDSFQGMEFDIIVFSFTRSARPTQENKKVGFLDDARRLNVAFSRAKKKLILVGNSSTLTNRSSHYDHLFNYTNLFEKLVKLSKDPDVGQYCDMTDFKELKSPYQRFKEKYSIGDITNAVVKMVVDYGIFVTVDGVDGLVHISNISYAHITKVNDLFEIDQKIRVKVLKYDDLKQRIEFGIKQISDFKEWDQLVKDCPRGSIITVIIDNVTDYGVFVNLTSNIKGLIHKNELDPCNGSNHTSYYKKGDRITAQIINYNVEKKRISLSESRALHIKKGANG